MEKSTFHCAGRRKKLRFVFPKPTTSRPLGCEKSDLSEVSVRAEVRGARGGYVASLTDDQMETLNRLLEFHGPQSKAIVWEHNTHIGDARYTDMKTSGMFNIGQLAREKYSENETVLIGFGSYQGTVIAGKKWGAPMQEMDVPKAMPDSIEGILHKESTDDRLIIFDRAHEEGEFNRVIPHRAIGVVYHPQYEQNNYVPSYFRRRYDAFMFFDRTKALNPLHIKPDKSQVPETYPFEF